MRNNKYPKVTGYWVYTHRTPDNMYYVGQSKQQHIYQRWQPSLYRNMSLFPYIEQYGWENIEHLVVKGGLTKEQASYWEERLIQMYTEMGCCINNNHSGNCTADIKAYNRQRNQCPERKAYNRQYNQRPERKVYRREFMQEYDQQSKRKIYMRVKSYNHNHPDKKLISPLEAKEMYELTGYIPDFIKSDDLI